MAAGSFVSEIVAEIWFSLFFFADFPPRNDCRRVGFLDCRYEIEAKNLKTKFSPTQSLSASNETETTAGISIYPFSNPQQRYYRPQHTPFSEKNRTFAQYYIV